MQSDEMQEFEFQIECDGRISMSADDVLIALAAVEAQRRGRRMGPPSPDAQMLSPVQVAVILGVGRPTVDRMIGDGTLRAMRFRQGQRKGLWGVSRKVLEKWMVEQEENTGGRNDRRK